MVFIVKINYRLRLKIKVAKDIQIKSSEYRYIDIFDNTVVN